MDAIDWFFLTGSQYYIAGRFGAVARLNPVVGNLLHHAIEMYLKGALSTTKTLIQLKQLSHGLPGIWEAFKVQANDVGLNRFDATIAALHRYEEIRYPDDVLADGMASTINIVRSTVVTKGLGASVPQYELCVQDIDELVEAIFSAASRNPKAYLAFNGPARDFLIRDNAVSQLTAI